MIEREKTKNKTKQWVMDGQWVHTEYTYIIGHQNQPLQVLQGWHS